MDEGRGTLKSLVQCLVLKGSPRHRKEQGVAHEQVASATADLAHRTKRMQLAELTTRPLPN